MSFVIDNIGKVSIYTNGVELEPGSCRGCPSEHLDKIKAEKGAQYRIVNVGEPQATIMDEKGKDVTPEVKGGEIIFSNEIFLPVGKLSEIIDHDETLMIVEV